MVLSAFLEWWQNAFADLLDKLAPTWSHPVRCIIQIGPIVAATAAITINGVTREGIGTGPADSETGIKKAEHDASNERQLSSVSPATSIATKTK